MQDLTHRSNSRPGCGSSHLAPLNPSAADNPPARRDAPNRLCNSHLFQPQHHRTFMEMDFFGSGVLVKGKFDASKIHRESSTRAETWPGGCDVAVMSTRLKLNLWQQSWSDQNVSYTVSHRTVTSKETNVHNGLCSIELGNQ
eukprot:1138859-Pelagomonas_calceolata.AAC.1